MTSLALVCFDMAGTTIADSGLVLEAFRQTIREFAVTGDEALAMERYVTATMGQSKIDVFTHLFAEEGASANEVFELHFATAARRHGVSEIPGAHKTMAALRARGISVALTTGFAPATRDLLIDLLDWQGAIDLAVSPADAGRGRPAPDMILRCATVLGVDDLLAVVVVGDTAADMAAGRNGGVGCCIGVRSGADADDVLERAGADVMIDSVADLEGVLAFS